MKEKIKSWNDIIKDFFVANTKIYVSKNRFKDMVELK